MAYLLMFLAIITLVIAHYFKIFRMRKFIEIYEKPNDKVLIQALSLSYIINFIFPFKVIGELARSWYQGRKMRNGVSFGLATVIVDRLLDILVVAFIFLLFYIIGFRNEVITSSIIFYLILIVGITLFLILMLKSNIKKYVKIIIMKFACIFNERIELRILKVSWFVISSFKDLIEQISKRIIVLYTFLAWGFYLLSYVIFALALCKFGHNSSVVDVFISLFSSNNLITSTGKIALDSTLMISYSFISTAILFLTSYLVKSKKNVKKEYFELLPQINYSDKLMFLEGYFSGKSQAYFNTYIKINRNISIIKDYSAGSNATTMLCMKDKKMFFRKYSIGEDSEKLYAQIKWIKDHQKNIPLTEIVNEKKESNYCLYDMPYNSSAVGCFNYIHTVPIADGWKVIEKALNSIHKNLHSLNVRKADKETIHKYISSKVTKNLEKVKNAKYIKPLLKYDNLIINGKKYHNLSYFESYLTEKFLTDIFKNDTYSDIHGDFTIENIIALPKTKSFYIIDPNTGNLHDSPCLDYAKLLQSLHGGYEFFMNTKTISINGNEITYMAAKSLVYNEVYNCYDQYLVKKFNKETVRSIYFHEVIHWLRLLPYKIEKNGVRSVLFYCGLVIVLNDIVERFGDKK